MGDMLIMKYEACVCRAKCCRLIQDTSDFLGSRILTTTYNALLCMYIYICGKAMTNYPQELAQGAVCQSHTGHMTGL